MRPHWYAYAQGDDDSGAGAQADTRTEGPASSRPAVEPDLVEGEGGQPAKQASGGAGSGRGRQSSTSLSQIGGDRPIFTLSVAADLLGLHPRTLRIYEEKKLVVPARTVGNRRRYSQNDIQRFQFIRRLTQAGVNLEGVRIILDMADELSRLGADPNAIIERNLQSLDEP